MPNGHVLGPDTLLSKPQTPQSSEKNFRLQTGRIVKKTHPDEERNRAKRATEYEILIDSGINAGRS